MNEPLRGAISRRRLLQAGAVGAVGAWLPTIKIPVASAGAGVCPTPPKFPAGIDLYRQGFENWAKALVIDDLWTCAPRSAEEVVELANWAHRHGWRLRPRGSMHGWSPICITPGTGCDDPVVLADTTAHLTGIEVVSEDGPAEYEISANGLAATNAFDLWGKSKNTLLYIRPTTLRVDELGLAVITDRARIQQVLHEVATYYSRRLAELRAQGRFPTNGPLQLRCSGLDRPAHVGIHGAESPALGATVPRRDRSWDVAIWLNFLNTPGTPGEFDLYAELERFCRSRFRGFAAVRPEWSKGWASAGEGLWTDEAAIRRLIPRSLSAGRRADEDWDWATRRLQRYDPHGVLSNDFLDGLVRPRRR